MAVLSLLISLGCVALTWLLFVSVLQRSSPSILIRFKESGINVAYNGFSKAFYFRPIHQYNLTLNVSLTSRSTSKKKARALQIMSTLSVILGTAFTILSIAIIIWSIWSSFNKKEVPYTLTAPHSNMLTVFLCLCGAVLFHELGHLLLMYSTKTPIRGFEVGIRYFIPFVTIFGALNSPGSISDSQKETINAIGGILGNISTSLIALALAYLVSYRTRTSVSSTSLFVYLGESPHDTGPYSLVQSVGNTSIHTPMDLDRALRNIEAQYVGDYGAIELLVDDKNTFSLVAGIRQSIQAQLAYQNSGALAGVADRWPPYSSSQSLGGIQIPYTALENMEPLQCHVPQDGVPILLSHYHVLSTSHLLVLSPYVVDNSLLSTFLSNDQSSLCHYSTADYVCMYPYFFSNDTLNVSGNGVYTRSIVNGIQQLIPLPISGSHQTLTLEGWKRQYQRHFVAVPTSLVGTASDTKELEVAIQRIRKTNTFTFIVQIFTETSAGMAILASLGFPFGSDGQHLLHNIVRNKSTQAIAQSAFWASSLTLCCLLALSTIYSLF
ncbi:Hypothetical protein GLP15_4718 [Giardia lamblia P15]|uniref:Peptidase M50 domain-containing protein n=1 Tax=Giardia intestinalis (strain P15) TaxID=658858 RepID=E1F1P0_GIAIA|nr:Hypothetical protein GLP15_4718 [Giardia lamblia P15]